MTGTTSYYHFDGLGSTACLTNSSAQVTDEYQYTAFGEEIGSAGDTTNLFRFVGQVGYYADDETGTTYVRQRSYAPQLIRWLSEDPIESDACLYRYASNMPVINTDPSGLEDTECKCSDILDDFKKNWKESPIGGDKNVKLAMQCGPHIICSDDCGGPNGQTFKDENNFIIVCLAKTAKSPQLMYGLLLHELQHVAQLIRAGKSSPYRCGDPGDNPKVPRLRPPPCAICKAREKEAYQAQANFLYTEKSDRDKFVTAGVCNSCQSSCREFQKGCPKFPGPPTAPMSPPKKGPSKK